MKAPMGNILDSRVSSVGRNGGGFLVYKLAPNLEEESEVVTSQ